MQRLGDPKNYKGIDISSNNPDIDLAQAKADGFQIVYIKATEGLRYVNPLMMTHYQQAKDLGMFVGFYHFFNMSDATEQATHFCNVIAALSYDCLPCLDVEAYPKEEELTEEEKINFSIFTHEAMNQIAYLTKKWPLLYANTNYCRNYFKGEYLNMYPLWVADYNNSGYPGKNPIWDTWAGYQYTSTGLIGGVEIDMNEFTADVLLSSHENTTGVVIPETKPMQIIYKGKTLVVPIDESGDHARVFVRDIFESMGDVVTWDEATRTINVD